MRPPLHGSAIALAPSLRAHLLLAHGLAAPARSLSLAC